MPTNKWHVNIDLSDLWNDPENLPMRQREEIAARLRASRWPQVTSDRARLDHLVQELVEADDRMAEVIWNILYDLADADRVFLDIFGFPTRTSTTAEHTAE